MKKMFLIFFISFVILVTGCGDMSNNEEFNFETRSMDDIKDIVSEENVNDLITKEYSNKELNKIGAKNLNLENLDKIYRIECIKKDTYYPSSTYKVVYKSKDKFLFICFDEDGEKIYSFIVSMSKEKKEFDFVKIGIDKKTKIYLNDFNLSTLSYLSFSLRHGSRLSTHYTKDGYLITFEYDESDTVVDKSVVLI